MPSTILEKDQAQLQRPNLETRVRAYGEKIFDLIEQADSPSLFSKKGFYGTLMEWAMKDEHFKTQLFRFVDVLPTLTSASEIARHLKEYLGEDQVNLSPALRLGLKAAGGASWLLGAGVKSQITGMARQFMLGDDPKILLQSYRSDRYQYYVAATEGRNVGIAPNSPRYSTGAFGFGSQVSCWLGPPRIQRMITECSREIAFPLAAAVASALSRSGNDNPANPSTPILRKERRSIASSRRNSAQPCLVGAFSNIQWFNLLPRNCEALIGRRLWHSPSCCLSGRLQENRASGEGVEASGARSVERAEREQVFSGVRRCDWRPTRGDTCFGLRRLA